MMEGHSQHNADQPVGQDDYGREIKDALQKDEQRIGDVWREQQKLGKDAEAIKDALGMGTSGPVYACFGSIDTLLRCEVLTNGTVLAAQRARMLRSFAKRHDLSSTTRSKLEGLADNHQQRAQKNEEVSGGDAEHQALQPAAAELLDKPGVYVYTLPHYRINPVEAAPDGEQSNDRTFLKIGMSDVGVRKRVQQQATTALPEPIEILRHYVFRDGQTGSYKDVETKCTITSTLPTIIKTESGERARSGSRRTSFSLTLLPIFSVSKPTSYTRRSNNPGSHRLDPLINRQS